jgi:hypothetical protein
MQMSLFCTVFLDAEKPPGGVIDLGMVSESQASKHKKDGRRTSQA